MHRCTGVFIIRKVKKMGSVGERIKEIRTSKGITQADLADALDTTTAAISRYEQGKREVRFPQAKAIADFLGVPVYDLYGFSGERQAEIEKIQETISDIREQMKRNLAEYPDGSMQGMDESLQQVAEMLEKNVQDELNLAGVVHRAQIRATSLMQSDKEETLPVPTKPDLAIKRRNKRTDSLVSMFSGYPDDVQGRVLDLVSVFGQLNSAGQKHAVSRVRELAELPRYQAQPDVGWLPKAVSGALSQDEVRNLEYQCHRIREQLLELDLMEQSMVKNKSAVMSSCCLIEDAMGQIAHILLERFRCPAPEHDA